MNEISDPRRPLASKVASPWLAALGVAAVFACGGPVDEAERATSFSAASPVLDLDGSSLGSIAFSTSCSPAANEEMRRGLGLLHHMTYVEAEGAFARAAEADPECGLAYWGIALTYVHPLWPDVPSDEAFAKGWELLQKARGTGSPGPRELAYIAALEAYYRDGPNRTEAERLASYAEAWEKVAAEHPSDPEAALFRALSLMATASNADKTHAVRSQAGEIAEAVLAAIPDHPGAHHYVIHAYDVPPLADRALAAARNYGAVAPDNAHALHMTSHIFTRVGFWEESIEFNRRSADAALRHPIDGAVSHHHLHALDYLAYAHLQRDDPQAAADVLDHLGSLTGPVVNNAVSAYAFAAVPARIALERQDWERAATVPARWPETIRWDAFPEFEAIPQFARALGAARARDFEAAERAVTRLQELRRQAAEQPGAYDWGTQVEIQATAASAWIAFGRGDTEEALTLMTQAADLESTTEKNPVTPGEVLPARELLGDMLVELGRYGEAIEAYRLALERSPRRLNSLYGAGRAAELAGDEAAAREYYAGLLDLVVDAASSDRVVHARRFVTGQ